MEDPGAMDPSGWGGHIAQLFGAGGLALVIREFIKRKYARADKGDEVAAGLRKELVSRIEALERSLTDLAVRYTALENRERALYRKSVQYESEYNQLHRRYTALIKWIQSEPSLPQPPVWLLELTDSPFDKRRKDGGDE